MLTPDASKCINFHGRSLPAPPEPPMFPRQVEIVPLELYGPGLVRWIEGSKSKTSCWICKGNSLGGIGHISKHCCTTTHLRNLYTLWLTTTDAINAFAERLGVERYYACRICNFSCVLQLPVQAHCAELSPGLEDGIVERDYKARIDPAASRIAHERYAATGKVIRLAPPVVDLQRVIRASAIRSQTPQEEPEATEPARTLRVPEAGTSSSRSPRSQSEAPRTSHTPERVPRAARSQSRRFRVRLTERLPSDGRRHQSTLSRSPLPLPASSLFLPPPEDTPASDEPPASYHVSRSQPVGSLRAASRSEETTDANASPAKPSADKSLPARGRLPRASTPTGPTAYRNPRVEDTETFEDAQSVRDDDGVSVCSSYDGGDEVGREWASEVPHASSSYAPAPAFTLKDKNSRRRAYPFGDEEPDLSVHSKRQRTTAIDARDDVGDSNEEDQVDSLTSLINRLRSNPAAQDKIRTAVLRSPARIGYTLGSNTRDGSVCAEQVQPEVATRTSKAPDTPLPRQVLDSMASPSAPRAASSQTDEAPTALALPSPALSYSRVPSPPLPPPRSLPSRPANRRPARRGVTQNHSSDSPIPSHSTLGGSVCLIHNDRSCSHTALPARRPPTSKFTFSCDSPQATSAPSRSQVVRTPSLAPATHCGMMHLPTPSPDVRPVMTDRDPSPFPGPRRASAAIKQTAPPVAQAVRDSVSESSLVGLPASTNEQIFTKWFFNLWNAGDPGAMTMMKRFMKAKPLETLVGSAPATVASTCVHDLLDTSAHGHAQRSQ